MSKDSSPPTSSKWIWWSNPVNARWRQRRCNKTETGLFEEQIVKQKEQIEAAYDSYTEAVEHSFAFRKLSDSGYLANLNRTQSQLERTYTHALRDLLRLQQLRESKKHSAERTQSQERTYGAARVSKRTDPRRTETAHAAIRGVNLTKKLRSHPNSHSR